MRESVIERYLVKRCKDCNILCYKFSSPGRRAVPDRILISGDGLVVFAELKATGKRPTKLQVVEMDRLTAHGQRVLVIDSKEDVDVLIEGLWYGP